MSMCFPGQQLSSAKTFLQMFLRKSRGDMAPVMKGGKGWCGGEAPSKFFDHALFSPIKRLILAQRLATYTRKSCKNERAKMKESRQNNREIQSTG